MSSTEKGYLLIADITGYTMYLSQSELEHAQDVLHTLLELLIKHTRPPLVISRLAGDAVISYGLQENFISGQTFIEMLEDTYVAFRKAIELIVLNNTCECNACTNVASLDLKFFVHHGQFSVQQLGEHKELVGSDVNLLHRLLKNSVTEITGVRAYTLYSDAAIHRLGLTGFEEQLIPHQEHYEHLGEVKVWIHDMQPIWMVKKEQVRLQIAPGDVVAHQEGEFPLPPHVMWELVTDPEYRAIFVQSLRQEVINRQDGRLAPGSVYQCFHGDGSVTTQTILEWQPFEQMTTEDTTPVPGATMLNNIRLTPTEKGTKVAFTASKARGRWLYRVLCNLVVGFILPAGFRKGMREFEARVEQELAAGKRLLPEAAAISEEQLEQAAVASLIRE